MPRSIEDTFGFAGSLADAPPGARRPATITATASSIQRRTDLMTVPPRDRLRAAPCASALTATDSPPPPVCPPSPEVDTDVVNFSESFYPHLDGARSEPLDDQDPGS